MTLFIAKSRIKAALSGEWHWQDISHGHVLGGVASRKLGARTPSLPVLGNLGRMAEQMRMFHWFSAQRWNYWPCCCLTQIKSNYQHHMKHHQNVRNRSKHLQRWLGVERPRIKPADETKQRRELSLPTHIPEGASHVQPQGGLFCYSRKRAWKIFSSFSRPTKFPLLFPLQWKSKLVISILGLFSKACPCSCPQVLWSQQEPSST